MKLNPVERIGLLQVIPREGTPTTLKIVRDLQTSLSFTEVETAKYLEVVETSQGKIEGFKKDILKDEVDLPVGLKALEIIHDTLDEKAKKKTLQYRELELWERFVENYDTELELAKAKPVQNVNSDVKPPA
jgi:hypothetical protein